MSESIAARLATEVAAWRTAPLPPAVLGRSRELLLDYLGVTLGGAGEASSVTLRRGLAALGSEARATVIGTRERLPVTHAAIANGAAAHALEMDDTHQGGSIHLGASVFSAALAAAELVPATGEAILRAAVAGYEVAARLAMALDPAAHYERGFHPTGTCGVFGAAAAASLVLGLDAAAITSAFGIAGSQAAGSMEFLADGSWTKRLHPGWAASAGVHAAALARAGFRGPASIVEGRAGFLAAYSPRPVVDRLTGGAGYEIMHTAVKPHACCRYMQGPIDGVLALRATHGIDAGTVDQVAVGMLSAGYGIVCEPAAAKRRPASVVEAQFSLPFGVAAALVHGAVSPDEFAAASFTDERVRAVMDRVVAECDAALDARYPREWPAWVRITLRDGRCLATEVPHPRGDPENFLPAAALEAKFRRLAARVLTAAQTDRLLAEVARVAAAPSVRSLLDASMS
jgi:2-methylcitrate dehydratase PrpD